MDIAVVEFQNDNVFDGSDIRNAIFKRPPDGLDKDRPGNLLV